MSVEPQDSRPRWRKVFDLLRTRQPADPPVTYDELAALLQLDPVANRTTIATVTRRAGDELLTVEKKAITTVRGVGYAIVEPGFQLTLAERQQSRAITALHRGHALVTNVPDLSEESPEVRRKFEIVATALCMQMDISRRMDVRQSNVETALASVQDEMRAVKQNTADQYAEVTKRLEALERERLHDDPPS